MKDPAVTAYRSFITASATTSRVLNEFVQHPTKANRKVVISAKNRETEKLRHYIDIIYGRAAVRTMLTAASTPPVTEQFNR